MTGKKKRIIRGVRGRCAYILRALLPFARRSRGWFIYGCIAAAGIVAARLALPWPLQAVIDHWVSPDQGENSVFVSLVPTGFNFVLSMGALFLTIILLLGLFDFLGRLYFARFAIGTVHDIREKAFWSLMRAQGKDPDDAEVEAIALDEAEKMEEDEDEDDPVIGTAQSGNLIACLIGDSARVKAGLRGFILHVATNSVMYLGVTIILFTMDVNLGLVFAAAGVGTAVITIWCAARIFKHSVQYRKKEGQLAQHIHNALDNDPNDAVFIKINKKSGRTEATLAQITGIATWSAHVLFGSAVLCALWIGSEGIEAGRIQISDLVMVIMYALLTRGPIIRLARQGSRTGKIFGAAYRLVKVLKMKPNKIKGDKRVRLMPLHEHLKLSGVTLAEPGSQRPQAELFEVKIEAGQRIALVGDPGSGQTEFLDIIAGIRKTGNGNVLWDSISIGKSSFQRRSTQIVYLQHDQLSAEVDTKGLSLFEQRLRNIAYCIYRRASVWLFDDPTRGLSDSESVEVMNVLLRQGGPRSTVIVATNHGSEIARFDRLIQLEKGRLIFDGTPTQWLQTSLTKPSASVAANVARERHAWQSARKKMPTSANSKFRILFTGYAHVHFICFKPLYDYLTTLPGVEVYVSGGLRTKTEDGFLYNPDAMYGRFQIPEDKVLTVDEIKQQDFDVLFAGNTKMIMPRSVPKRIQIFHGLSFRNKAIRPDNMSWDHYFIVGPYMRRRFAEAGFLPDGDERAVEVGFMKTDLMLNGQLTREQVLDSLGLDGKRPVVLYAPTGAKKNSLEIMGEEVIRQLAATNKYDLLIKPHDHPKNKNIDWFEHLTPFESAHCKVTREPDVIKLLYVTDLLISDASSVTSEFSLLDRPIIYLDTPELIKKAGKADNSMLDLDTWGRKCGVVVEQPTDIADAVEQGLSNVNQLSEQRRTMARDLFYNPGTATDVAIAWVKEHVLSPQAWQ